MSCLASVIIPVYNAEKTLRRCVESLVLGQERNIEVIMVDDYSKDESWPVCLELAAEFNNVIAIQNQKNSGVSYTRNRGLEVAQGEYILFVDSDDWVSKRYVQTLVQLARNYPNTLPICGQHFIDKVHGDERNYTWNDHTGEINIVSNKHFFELSDKFLLQQLWNKIFMRSVIERAHLWFDETQNMGEDFQFVLDYLEVAKIQHCVTISEPLYYYIRWNKASLMSNYGLQQNEEEYQRAEQLCRLAGEENDFKRAQMIHQIRQNYVYHISRNEKLDRTEKLKRIECIMKDGKAAHYYRQQQILRLKEDLKKGTSILKTLPQIISGRWRQLLNRRIVRQVRGQVEQSGITIISQNCVGGMLYNDFGMQFQSPTINTFFKASDYVRFAGNLMQYANYELKMRWEEEYPVGILDDVEIHFMHYATCQEAKDAWERRVKRICWDKIIILATDRDGFDDEVFMQWKNLSMPKVLFTAQEKYADDPNSIYYPRYSGYGVVTDDLISQKAYYKDGILLKIINSL